MPTVLRWFALLMCDSAVCRQGEGILEDLLRWAGSHRTRGVPRAFGYAREEAVIGLDLSISLPSATAESQGAQRSSLHWRGADEERMAGEEKDYNSQHAARSAVPGELCCALEPGLGRLRADKVSGWRRTWTSAEVCCGGSGMPGSLRASSPALLGLWRPVAGVRPGPHVRT